MEAERKHHCRSCGEGFCHPCSSHRMPVPERGWGSGPVRVCKACYRQGGPGDTNSQGETLPTNECTSTRQLVLNCINVILIKREVLTDVFYITEQASEHDDQSDLSFTSCSFVLSKLNCYFIVFSVLCCTCVSLFPSVCKVEPRGLIARRVTEVAQSTVHMVTTAVDYPLCESSCISPSHIDSALCSRLPHCFSDDSYY